MHKYIYIYTHLNLYICVSILVHGVFRWRNPHLEQITFRHYPYLYLFIYIFKCTHLNLYPFIRILVYVRMSIHCIFHEYVYFYTFEPIYMYTFVSICICACWRNPHLEQITFCRYP